MNLPNDKAVSYNIPPCCRYMFCINKYVHYKLVTVFYVLLLQLCWINSSLWLPFLTQRFLYWDSWLALDLCMYWGCTYVRLKIIKTRHSTLHDDDSKNQLWSRSKSLHCVSLQCLYLHQLKYMNSCCSWHSLLSSCYFCTKNDMTGISSNSISHQSHGDLIQRANKIRHYTIS